MKFNTRVKKAMSGTYLFLFARLVPVKEPSIPFVNRVKYFFPSLCTTVIKFPEQNTQ